MSEDIWWCYDTFFVLMVILCCWYGQVGLGVRILEWILASLLFSLLSLLLHHVLRLVLLSLLRSLSCSLQLQRVLIDSFHILLLWKRGAPPPSG